MNFKTSKTKFIVVVLGGLFLISGILAGIAALRMKQNITGKAVAATNIYFSPDNQSIVADDSANFTIVMDTGVNHITGLDLIIKFDPNIFEVDSLTKGQNITNFKNTISDNFDNTTGTIRYAIFTLDKKLAVNGTGLEILKINGKVKDNVTPGNYQFDFDSSTAISATNETRSVLAGSTPGTYTVTQKPSPTISPTPNPTPSNAPTAGDPNSCGGTCGSNNNCQTNYMCFQGFCRNPNCPYDTSCGCKTPTPSPTTRPSNSPSSEPVVVLTPKDIYTSPTQTDAPTNYWQNVYNDNESTPFPDSTFEPINTPETQTSNITPWIIGALAIGGVALIFVLFGIYKYAGLHRVKPPVIKL